MSAKCDLIVLLETLPYWQRAGLYMAGVLPFDEPSGISGDMTDAEAKAILRRIESAAPERQRDLFSVD